jgi:hypothetical protein
MNVKLHIAQFLETLGWKFSQYGGFDIVTVHTENTLSSVLRVDNAKRGNAAGRNDVFVLSASGKYEKCVPRTLVHADRPRWQRKVHAWYQAATLAIADAKREEEEENARARRAERTLDDLVRTFTGDDVEPAEIRRLVTVEIEPAEIRRLVTVEIEHGADNLLSVADVTRRYFVNDMFVFQRNLPVGEKLAKLARLVRFLRSEQMLPSQYNERKQYD